MEQLGIDRGDLISKKKRPNLTFEEGSYTLPELLESHLLPVVAQYDVSRQPIPFHEFNFDLSQPLLLYKKRHIQKVAAHSLYINNDKYDEIGESILIPEDYKGWFAVLQRLTGYTKADDAVPHFTTIEELAESNTERFLIGGTKKINGLHLVEGHDPTQHKHDQCQFIPGDILTREKIYYGETKKRTRLFRKPKYTTEKFLKCRDEADHEILLPFEQAGIFYQVSHKYGKANKNVMQMSDIVARKLTPRIIKLVFGRFPVTPSSFTGLMRAESSNIETSIIAATMVNTKNILMEIPVSSSIYFRVANMDSDLRRNECYRNAMGLCVERAITYMRNIKVCYNFTVEDDTEAEVQIQDQRMDDTPTNECDESSRNDQTNIQFDEQNENTDFGRHDILRSQLQRSYFKAMDVPRVFSVDIPDEVSIRPARCRSTGRMSFCLGNNYLTVPMLEPSIYKRNSGNNNTIHEISCTTKRGSRISFNGTFFEEESGDELEAGTTVDRIEETDIPSPMACTNSYVNTISPVNPATDWDPSDFSSLSRQTSQPPDIAPPPLPRSSCTSGGSIGSTSSSSDSTHSNQGSRDSFEYAVPKIQESSKSITNSSNTPTRGNNNAMKVTRRPSTYTFTEGTRASAKYGTDAQENKEIIDEEADNNEPIYENIKSLMELVTKLDEDDGDDDIHHESTVDEHALSTDLDRSEEVVRKLHDSNEKLKAVDENVHMSDMHMQEEELPSVVSEGSNEQSESELSFSCKVSASLVSTTDDNQENDSNIDFDHDGSITRSDDPDGVKSCPEPSEALPFDTLSEENSESRNEFSDECTSSHSPKTKCLSHELVKGDQSYDLEQSTNTKTKCDKHSEMTMSEEEEGDDGVQCQYMWRKALENFKHSDAVKASRTKIRSLQKPFNKLTVDEISEALISIGIKGQTIEQIKAVQVNGARLTEVLEGELSIRDCLSGVNLVDQQKISMFIRGWRPNSPE